MKKFIKKILINFDPKMVVFLRYVKNSIISYIWISIGVLFYKWKLFDVKKYRHGESKKVCHILGSGYSLLDSLSCIDGRDDFVIGFNFSGLAYHNCDLYFIEIARKGNAVSKAQYQLWKHLRRTSKTIFVFKNLWDEKNSLKIVDEKYGSNVYYLKDVCVGVENLQEANFLIDMMLNKDKFFNNEIQTISSVVVLVIIACNMGFKKIILHGVDFSGPHFYDLVRYSERELEDIRLKVSCKIIKTKMENHLTNTGKVTNEFFLKCLRKKLYEKKIILEAALEGSNLGKSFLQLDNSDKIK